MRGGRRRNGVHGLPVRAHRGPVITRMAIGVNRAPLDGAQGATGSRTEKDIVEEGLRLPVRLEVREEIPDLVGKVRW